MVVLTHHQLKTLQSSISIKSVTHKVFRVLHITLHQTVRTGNTGLIKDVAQC